MTQTQKEIVLRALRNAGSRGVHTFEMRQMFIANPSQRILELEAEGYVVSHARERLHGKALGARYTLIREPAHGSVTPAPEGSEALFELHPTPGSAIHGEAA